MERPRKSKKLPVVLSEEDIKALINKVENRKHRCILLLQYAAGLRISEVVNLKIEDINSKRNIIHIRQSKGNQDRTSLLSTVLLKELRLYYKEYRPKTYLFEGTRPGNPYSTSSIRKIMKRAVSASKVHPTIFLSK